MRVIYETAKPVLGWLKTHFGKWFGIKAAVITVFVSRPAKSVTLGVTEFVLCVAMLYVCWLLFFKRERAFRDSKVEWLSPVSVRNFWVTGALLAGAWLAAFVLQDYSYFGWAGTTWVAVVCGPVAFLLAAMALGVRDGKGTANPVWYRDLYLCNATLFFVTTGLLWLPHFNADNSVWLNPVTSWLIFWSFVTGVSFVRHHVTVERSWD